MTPSKNEPSKLSNFFNRSYVILVISLMALPLLLPCYLFQSVCPSLSLKMVSSQALMEHSYEPAISLHFSSFPQSSTDHALSSAIKALSFLLLRLSPFRPLTPQYSFLNPRPPFASTRAQICRKLRFSLLNSYEAF